MWDSRKNLSWPKWDWLFILVSLKAASKRGESVARPWWLASSLPSIRATCPLLATESRERSRRDNPSCLS